MPGIVRRTACQHQPQISEIQCVRVELLESIRNFVSIAEYPSEALFQSFLHL
jgi:hypothetical protein